MPTPWGTPTFEDRDRANRQRQLQNERDNYQRQIQLQNIENLRLQNAALSSSIRAMGGNVPGQSVGIPTGGSGGTVEGRRAVEISTGGSGGTVGGGRAVGSHSTGGNASTGGDFPSLAEIQSMIESSQKKAEEDFMGKINLLRNQEQQKQEEDQLSARNAASRMQSYQRQSAIGAWESALRGR